MGETKIIRPQEGYQMKALSSSADIVIGGGAAGVGKTFSLLLDPIRHINNPNFGGVFFRRTMPQIKAEGGLWDASKKLYNLIKGSDSRAHTAEWIFSQGSKLKFSHLQYEDNVLDWQGSEITYLAFDELTHFSKKMFFYMLTRNRSTCGVKPYVRATCNPDPDSWVAEFIDWWIDDEGWPIPEREGKLRYFTRDGDSYIWGDSVDEVYDKAEYLLAPLIKKSGIDKKHFIKSVTFISGSIYDNKELLEVDPSYLGNLNAQDKETRAQLLDGNWKVKQNAQDLFNHQEFSAMFDNPFDVKTGKHYISADIAMQGSDKFVVGVWNGWELIDIKIMDKSNGAQVLQVITDFQKEYKVGNSNVVYDNDGVGSFLGGFVPQGTPFNNGSKAKLKENYANLKTQCYYRIAKRVNNNEIIISEKVANKMYDDKKTIRQQFMFERKAIKKAKKDIDGKLKLLPKDEMKVILDGKSPDLMDMFMMREIFDIYGEFVMV